MLYHAPRRTKLLRYYLGCSPTLRLWRGIPPNSAQNEIGDSVSSRSPAASVGEGGHRPRCTRYGTASDRCLRLHQWSQGGHRHRWTSRAWPAGVKSEEHEQTRTVQVEELQRYSPLLLCRQSGIRFVNNTAAILQQRFYRGDSCGLSCLSEVTGSQWQAATAKDSTTSISDAPW